jgi:hypothetical protein
MAKLGRTFVISCRDLKKLASSARRGSARFDNAKLQSFLFNNMSISKIANGEGAQEDVEAAMDPPDTKPVSNALQSAAESTTGDEATNQQQESSLAEADVSKKKLCSICNEKEWKYKCTRCYLPT